MRPKKLENLCLKFILLILTFLITSPLVFANGNWAGLAFWLFTILFSAIILLASIIRWLIVRYFNRCYWLFEVLISVILLLSYIVIIFDGINYMQLKSLSSEKTELLSPTIAVIIYFIVFGIALMSSMYAAFRIWKSPSDKGFIKYYNVYVILLFLIMVVIFLISTKT